MENHITHSAPADSASAFDALLEACAHRAYNFALRLSGNDQDAQDMVQEAFARAYEHKDRYDASRPFEAWLNKILYNIHLDSVRRYETKHKVSLDADPPTERESSWADIVPGDDPEPLNEIVKKEEEMNLQRALLDLPLHYRTAVILFDIEERSYDEISELLKIPIGTVSSRIHQGRVLLKKSLSKLEKGAIQKTHERT